MYEAASFNEYLLRKHPDGLPLASLTANFQTSSGLEVGDIIKIVKSSPEMFQVRKDENDSPMLVAIPADSASATTATATATASGSQMRTAAQPVRAGAETKTKNEIETTDVTTKTKPVPNKKLSAKRLRAKQLRTKQATKNALDFYNEVLKENEFLRERCQEKSVFYEEYNSWVEKEKATRRNFGASNPSNILHLLRYELHLVDAIANEDAILWRDTPITQNDNTGTARNMTRDERVKNVIKKVKHNRKQLEKDRNNIKIDQITFALDDNSVAPIGTTLAQKVEITNTSSEKMQVTVRDRLAFNRGFTVELPKTARNKTFNIEGNTSSSVHVSCLPLRPGLEKCILSFEIAPSKSKAFVIVRFITVKTTLNPKDFSILKPASPYKKKKASGKGKFSKILRIRQYKGSDNGTAGQPFKNLQQYRIEKHVREAIKNESILDDVIALHFIGEDLPEEIPSDLSNKLSINNYRGIFQRLLWMEECTMERDIQHYDMEKVLLERKGNFYAIHVPGLAESRPSVLRGDKIMIECNGRCFEGVVQRTELEHAILCFPKIINKIFVSGLLVDVRFSFKRMGLRLCHDAIDTIQSDKGINAMFKQILFPERQNMKPLPSMMESRNSSKFVWHNRDLNEEQRKAVEGAISCVFRPLPYVIWGPPGTGKTVTLVESILQTVRAKRSDEKSPRVLVCAPSNQATDLILQRLSPYLKEKDMLRILAFSRARDTVPSDVLKYAYYNDKENGFVIPPEALIKQKTVVCVTISSGAKLPFHNVLGHFTHIFIDEAGHAMEPEAISCFTKSVKVSNEEPPAIVLAGDPKQLGPVIRSNMAKSFGLEKSLLERLHQRLENETLQDNPSITTKLIRNYRSHPAILKCPNERFYGGDLIASADPILSKTLERWEHLPNPKKKFPIIFHGVLGEDSREDNSPSWFNSSECEVVRQYVDKLLKDTKKNKVKPEEIGIISPYFKQVQKIRMLIGAHGHSDCEVGSIEQFQGSERRVIIISTVRSSVEYLQYDNKYKLGFLSNPKRFNVAITRAKALLIVIGNPNVLVQDPHWKSFIEYTIESGGYTGCEFKIDGDGDCDIDELSMISFTTFDEKENDVLQTVSPITAQEGPAWRSEE